jgi:hypothetical protein
LKLDYNLHQTTIRNGFNPTLRSNIFGVTKENNLIGQDIPQGKHYFSDEAMVGISMEKKISYFNLFTLIDRFNLMG